MFPISAVSWPAVAALILMWVRLVSDIRSESMCTHAAAMADAEAEADADGSDERDIAWLGCAAGLLELELELLQPATSATPQLSAARAKQVRLTECLGPADLIVMSLVMLAMPTQAGGVNPHPERW